MPKYVIRATRYVRQTGEAHPKLVFAAPESPTVIDLPEGTEVDPGLVPFDAPGAQAEYGKHFVKKSEQYPTAVDVQSTPLAEQDRKAGKSKRASDQSPV